MMRLAITLLLLPAMAVLPACGGKGGQSGVGLAIGDQAPDIDLRGLYGTRDRSLKSYEGQVVLVNFWASWCIPCRLEMPELESLWIRYQDDGFVVLSVSVDADQRDAAAFLDAVPVSFPVAWDADGEVSGTYKVSTLPRSILVDRQGRVRGRYDGFDSATFEGLSREVAALLEETP